MKSSVLRPERAGDSWHVMPWYASQLRKELTSREFSDDWLFYETGRRSAAGSLCEPAMPLDVAEVGVAATRTRASMQIMQKPNLEKLFIMPTRFQNQKPIRGE